MYLPFNLLWFTDTKWPPWHVKPWRCTWLRVEKIVFLWVIHTHSLSNILHLHKSSKSQLWPSRLLQPNPNARWRLWQTHWQLCRVTDCTASLPGFLCAGLESVNVRAISPSEQWADPVCSRLWTGRTSHMNTMRAATPLLHLLCHVFRNYQHCGDS